MLRSYFALLAALVTWSAAMDGAWSRVALVALAVAAAAGLELVVGLVRRKLSTPPARPRASA